MTKRLTVLALGLLLVLSSTMTLKGTEKSSSKEINLLGIWKYNTQDNKKFATINYDDADWKEIDFTEEAAYLKPAPDEKHIWLRKNFNLSGMNIDHLYVHLIKSHVTEAVYINGHFIGGKDNPKIKKVTDAGQEKSYRIDKAFVKAGNDNVIAIRIDCSAGIPSDFISEIGVFDHGKFSTNTIDLSGTWRFRKSDYLKWMNPTHFDKSWEQVYIPFKGESYSFKDYDGMAWYRKTFELSDASSTSGMVIALGKIGDRDEVYINGERADRMNIDDNSINEEWAGTCLYEVPNNILKAGSKNVVTVRVFDHHQKDGLQKGALAIFPMAEYASFIENYISFKH